MDYSDAINMAVTAVSMDRMLDMNTKQEIIESLSRVEKLANIGDATEKAFKRGGELEINVGTHSWFYCVEDLVNWAESEE